MIETGNDFIPREEIPKGFGGAFFLRIDPEDGKRGSWSLGQLQYMGLVVPEEHQNVTCVELTNTREDQPIGKPVVVDVQPLAIGLRSRSQEQTKKVIALVPIDDIPFEPYRVRALTKTLGASTSREPVYRVL